MKTIEFYKLSIGEKFFTYGDIHLNYDYPKECLCVKTGEESAKEVEGINFLIEKTAVVFSVA